MQDAGRRRNSNYGAIQINLCPQLVLGRSFVVERIGGLRVLRKINNLNVKI